MKTCNTLIVIAILSATGTVTAQYPHSATDTPADNKVIYEAPAAIKPIEATAKTKAFAVAPQSFEPVDAFQEGVNVIDLGEVTAERIAEADEEAARRFGRRQPGPKRVGLVRELPEAINAVDSRAVLQTSFGDEQFVWTMALRSPNAHGMRVHFTDFDALEGSVVLYAYGQDNVIVRGPYTGEGPEGDGDFWTPSLPGDEVYIEMSGAEIPQFVVSEIIHFDQQLGDTDVDEGTDLSSPLSCHLDVMCHDVLPVARQATGQMNMIAGSTVGLCTGTMLNDRDDETWVPFFLTAEHCISSQAEVDSLEVVWFYQKDSCNGTLPDYDNLPRSTGGTLLESVSADDGNDMAFIRLAGEAPGGVGFAGWTTATSINGIGIHHPAGSWKRTNFLSPVGVCPGCLCVDGSDFDYYDMDNGLVQPGSSGSGIFTYDGKLAGQLYGRCSNTTDPDDMTCSNLDSFWAVYGEFEETYPRISWWLNTGGTLHVNSASEPPGDGTSDWPFTWISLALNSAWPGTQIKIAAGFYDELLTINQSVTLLAHGGTVTIGG